MKRSFESDYEREAKCGRIEEILTTETCPPLTHSVGSHTNYDDSTESPESSESSNTTESCANIQNFETNESSEPSESSDTDDVFNQDVFNPSYIEKQIIRQALALITRTNMSDWNSETQDDLMVLRQDGIVIDCESNMVHTDLLVQILYYPCYTSCKIIYSVGEEEYQTIYMSWQTEFVGSYEEFDTIYLSRYVNVSSYIFFTKSIRQSISLSPRGSREDSWCFFGDARNHLNNIHL